jgi:hypothetical protein
MNKNMNPSEDLTLSKLCERIESDNNNLCITQEIKTIDFDDLDFLSQNNIFKKSIWIYFFSCEIEDATLSQFVL